MQTIDTIVFDIGNVLLPWNPRWLFRALLPDDDAVERFLRDVGFDAWNMRFDAGESMAQGIAQHSERFPHYRPLFEAFQTRWEETLGMPDSAMLALKQELHAADYRVLALTNFSAETFPRARRHHPFLANFDGIVVSGEVGLTKPDPAIYTLLCDRYGVCPSGAVFIDDSLANVDGARAVGLHGVHFGGAEKLRAQLTDLGVLARVPETR